MSTFAGAIYSLMAAICWSIAMVLFKKSGDAIPPVALNYLKNSIGLVLLACSVVVMQVPLGLDSPSEDILILLSSGAIGIGVADTLLFRSLNILGASRSAIVACLYSPIIILISAWLLGEELSWLTGVGATCVVVGILLTGVGRRANLSTGELTEGIFLGVVSVALMGFGIVIAKPVLEVHPVLWTTTVRMLGGVAILTLFLLFSRKLRTQVIDAFRPRAIWRFALPGSIIGTYVALLFWIAGFKYTGAMPASILNQTSTLWVVLLAALFLREPLTPARIVAVSLGLVGSVVTIWSP